MLRGFSSKVHHLFPFMPNMLWGIHKFILSHLIILWIPTHLLPLALQAHGEYQHQYTFICVNSKEVLLLPGKHGPSILIAALHTIWVLVHVFISQRGLLWSPKQMWLHLWPHVSAFCLRLTLIWNYLAICSLIILCPSHSPSVPMFYENWALTWSQSVYNTYFMNQRLQQIALFLRKILYSKLAGPLLLPFLLPHPEQELSF